MERKTKNLVTRIYPAQHDNTENRYRAVSSSAIIVAISNSILPFRIAFDTEKATKQTPILDRSGDRVESTRGYGRVKS